MKNIVDCPRRLIYNTFNEQKITCKALPIPKDISFEELIKHPELYTNRCITIKDCEKCQDKKLPSLRKQIKSYAKAVKDWSFAGFPEISQEELERRWSICKQCNEYKDDICKACGCKISKNGHPIKNKLRMITSHCVKGLW